MSTTNKVGIIVLNWNRPIDTVECLESLLPYVKQQIATIICCDNGSTDNSLTIIRSWAKERFPSPFVNEEWTGDDFSQRSKTPGFILISVDVNRGYAAGNNIGIRCAIKMGGLDYLWILNNDTVVEKNALPELIAAAESFNSIGIFGCTLVDYDNPEAVQCAGGCRFYPLVTIMKNVFQGKKLYDVLNFKKNIRLDYISGASMFMRSSIPEQIGLLNESYFLYYEEIDYAKRLKIRTNYDIGWCKKSIVLHKGGVSTNRRSKKDSSGSWLSNYHENFSTLLYTLNQHRNLLPVAAPFRLTMKLATLVIFRRWRSFDPLIKAYWDFFFQKKAWKPDQHASKIFHEEQFWSLLDE
jgi:GT2 family glycosyltransferase